MKSGYIICQYVAMIVLIPLILLMIVIVNNELSLRKECEDQYEYESIDDCIHNKRVENERIMKMKIDEYNQLEAKAFEAVKQFNRYSKEELMMAYILLTTNNDDNWDIFKTLIECHYSLI